MTSKPKCRHDGGDREADRWCRFKGDPFCVLANANAYRPTLSQIRRLEEPMREWEPKGA